MKKKFYAMISMAVLLFCISPAAAMMERPAAFIEAPRQTVYGQEYQLAADREHVQETGFFHQLQGAVMGDFEDKFRVVIVYIFIFVFVAVMIFQACGLLGALFWAAWTLVEKILSKCRPKDQEECPHRMEFDSDDEAVRLKKANAVIHAYIKESLKYFVKIYAPLLLICIPLYLIWWLGLCLKAFFWLLDERIASIKELERILGDEISRRYRSRLTGIMGLFIFLLCWLAILIVLLVVVFVLVFCSAFFKGILSGWIAL